MRPFTACALFFCCASTIPSAASAQSASPASPQRAVPDVVVLADGSMFRGTLVERSPERVVLLLPTGETRMWSPSEVQSAGRDTSIGEPTMVQLAPGTSTRTGGPAVQLHVRTPRSDLTLHVLDTSVSVPVRGRFEPLRLDAFHPFCVAPCDAPIEAGTYTLGISRGDGSPQRAGPPLTLAADRWLTLEHEDRSALRAGGWTLVVLGPGAGAGVGAIAAALDWFEPEIPEIATIMIGLGIGTVIALIGAAMAATNDHNAIRASEHDPDAAPIERPAPPPRRPRRTPEPDAY